MAPADSSLPRKSEGPDETRTVVPASSRGTLRAQAATSESEQLATGTVAGSYILGGVLGSGGGGMIYAARHSVLGRPAAVKVLRSEMVGSPTMVARFLREATAVNTIRHPNIVDIYEFGELPDGRPFYVMELLAGTDLKKLLRVHGRYSPEETVELLGQVCRALEATHRAGIVHRDLKASNIILCDTDLGPVAKLVDFGIAKLLHPEPGAQGLTDAGSMLGTSHNMAPEQILGEVIDERTDIYALGVLLYQLLTAQLPFTAEQIQDVAWMHLQAPPPRPSQAAPVSPAIDAVVLRCMEKERERRYPTVTAFMADLRAACGLSSDNSDETARAVGVYVELRTAEGAGDDLDDAVMEDIAKVLDITEGALLSVGFLLPLQTSNAILAVRALTDRTPEVDRAEAIEVAEDLHRRLAARVSPDPRLHVNISVRAHAAIVRRLEGRLEVVGGPLLAIDQWAAKHVATDVFVNDAFEVTAPGNT
jgi:eukaryotic-like serine/threonine-protein kinase